MDSAVPDPQNALVAQATPVPPSPPPPDETPGIQSPPLPDEPPGVQSPPLPSEPPGVQSPPLPDEPPGVPPEGARQAPPLPGERPGIQAPPLPPGKSLLLFELDRARLEPLLAFTRRRVWRVLALLVGGMALGLLWLIPQVHTFASQANAAPLVRLLRALPAARGQPWWVVILRVLGLLGPLLAAISFFWLPGALWREAWLRRQSDLHLAVGRQGVLFFLPGHSRRWLLLPWQHIRSLEEETLRPDQGRRARLRTVLWRRRARLARLYRHGRRLDASAGERPAVRSPFAEHAALHQPRLALRVVCSGRLPVTGYHWLFRLSPFTPRLAPQAFRLETGWFAPLQTKKTSAAPERAARPRRAVLEASTLHTALLALWRDRALTEIYPPLPLPRVGGAFQLSAPGTEPGTAPAARRSGLAGWAMLPLIPLLSLEETAQMLAKGQPLTWAAALNAGTLSALALGLALLLAGMQRPNRQHAFLTGALLVAVGGLLNAAYGLAAFLVAWPWRFAEAPGQPFMAQEVLAGLLLVSGALALLLEGSWRPVPHPAPGQRIQARRAEVVLGVGLLVLGVARVLEDINLAVLSQSASAALQFLRDTLAEPLLPLAILGICTFGALVSDALRLALRVVQGVYGLVLAALVPLAFVLVQRALFGTALPLPWLPLLVLMVAGGLLAIWSALFGSRQT